MKNVLIKSIMIAATIAAVAPAIYAQTATPSAPATRIQVKMDRDEFLKTHEWDNQGSTWKLKSGVEAPVGVKTRDEVKAMRDQFLANNRWSSPDAKWIPIKTGPREMSKMTRAQVRAETSEFVRTHVWDNNKSDWVLRTSVKQ